MSISIWVRPLTKEELGWFRERLVGREPSFQSTISQSSISMMWSDRHFPKNYLNASLLNKKTSRAINGIQAFPVGLMPKYSGLKNIEINSNECAIYNYLILAAKALEIRIVTNVLDSKEPHPIFFDSGYSSVFFECISYVDQIISSWHSRRSVLVRLFGCMEPDPDTVEAKQIRENVIRILMRVPTLK